MMVTFPMAVKILMNAATIDGIIVTNMLRNLNNSHTKSTKWVRVIWGHGLTLENLKVH